MAVGRVYFSAASAAQNSPELHLCFIDYFIQPSCVGFLFDNKASTGQCSTRCNNQLNLNNESFSSLVNNKK